MLFKECPYRLERLPDLQVGRLNWVTALHNGERLYVLSLVGTDLQNAECRPVKDGWNRHPTTVVACSDLERHGCQWVAGSQAALLAELIWRKLSNNLSA